MHKIPSWFNLSLAICLVVISFWWAFFILWNPGVIQIAQQLAFNFDASSLDQNMVVSATARALEYAVDGLTQTQDIFFTGNEIRHLLDVHALYEPARVVLGIGALISFICLIFSIAKFNHLPARAFLLARNILLLFSALSLTAVLVFPSFFIKFHETFFPQGNWSFPASSILIQIFPETFWKLMLICFLGLLIIFVGIFHLASRELENE